jgi:glucose-6-phosphate 1-dehydrogenase
VIQTTTQRDGLSLDGANPLRAGIDTNRITEPCNIVFFGATGDLVKRMLLPAMYNLRLENIMPANFGIVGVSRDKMSDDEFRDCMKKAIDEFSRSGPAKDPMWSDFAKHLSYVGGGFDDDALYTELAEQLRENDKDLKTGGNVLYYLSTPPTVFALIIDKLDAAGLGPKDKKTGWSRIIVEKPFGTDMESARALQAEVSKVFDEKSVYRIDHYLGKEPVQDIMALRFANVIFEPIWNRRYIDSVQITAVETVGVEGRGGYYDHSGALRDMIQNHVKNLLALVAMEPPVSASADSIRDEKFKALSAIRPIPRDHVLQETARGQYGPGAIAGQPVPGYREEPSVDPNSNTETYAAVKLLIDNWRWADVPFYLRSGKRLARKNSEIAIRFKGIPHRLFGEMGDTIDNNVLVMKIQPEEGISLSFSAKVPGPKMHIRPVSMDFNYGVGFGVVSAPAYERLIGDAMRGDATLFTRWDAVETAWSVVMPRDARRDLSELSRGLAGPARGRSAAGGRQARVAQDMSTSILPTVDVTAIKAELAREHPHAMTMNLVVWNADAENRKWIVERAIAIGQKHPSRTIVLDASPQLHGAVVTTADDAASEQSALIEIGVAEKTAPEIAEIMHSLLVSDIPTVLWWSAPDIGPRTPFATLVAGADAAVVDSSAADGASTTLVDLVNFCSSHRGCAVRDLAWQRIHPWQDMVAHFFDDPHLREELFSIKRVHVVSGSDAEAFYLAGWLGSRLGWTATAHDAFADRNGNAIAFVHENAGRPRRVRSVALESATTTYQGERLVSDDLVVRLWAEGKYANGERLFGLQWVDGASLVERAILETAADEIFETALRMVGTLLG